MHIVYKYMYMLLCLRATFFMLCVYYFKLCCFNLNVKCSHVGLCQVLLYVLCVLVCSVSDKFEEWFCGVIKYTCGQACAERGEERERIHNCFNYVHGGFIRKLLL